MYGMFGGCTTLWHLAIQYPALVLSLALSGFAYQVNTQAPGNLMGTDAVLEQVQAKIVNANSGLPTQVNNLKVEFEKISAEPTEEQVRTVLKFTDACTDATVKDVLSSPVKRREAAWLLYLDVYSREGPKSANSLFAKSPTSAPSPKRE